LSPSRSSLLALAFIAAAAGVQAGPATFDVSGTLEPAPRGLAVRVVLRNVGGAPAEDVRVSASLMESTAAAETIPLVRASAASEAPLAFADAVPTPGVHALVLRLEYQSVEDGHGAPMNQYAYLLLGFGPSTAPAVRLDLPKARLADTAVVPIGVESLDGRAHRVELAIYLPRVMGAAPQRQSVDVPARGRAHADVRLFRATAAYESTHGLLAVAATVGEDVVRTAAATTVVEIGRDPAVLPRLGVRVFLVAVAFALLAAALYAERRRATPVA
jgi:hypothetical protein